MDEGKISFLAIQQQSQSIIQEAIAGGVSQDFS